MYIYKIFFPFMVLPKLTPLIPTGPSDLIKKCIIHNKNQKNKKPAKKPKFQCGICNFGVKHNDKAIFCTLCDKWSHISCSDVSIDEYRHMQLRNREVPTLVEKEKWTCMACIMDLRSEYVPFIYMSDNQVVKKLLYHFV